MDYDRRTGLTAGTILQITAAADTGGISRNHYTVEIGSEIARGGSCIAYHGKWKEPIGNDIAERSVIVKEFYPRNMQDAISRDEQGTLQFSGKEQSFQKLKQNFCQGQISHILYADQNAGNALPAALFLGEAGDTVYSVSSPGEGQVLSSVNRREMTLADAFAIVLSVCDGIARIHKDGWMQNHAGGRKKGACVYLDLKPDNLFVAGHRAYLFDFDSAQELLYMLYCSCTQDWSAPEQKLGKNGYEHPGKIGFHTDIFAIAAILLYLLTGRKPDMQTLEEIRQGLDWSREIDIRDPHHACKNKQFLTVLHHIMCDALDPDPDRRRMK